MDLEISPGSETGIMDKERGEPSGLQIMSCVHIRKTNRAVQIDEAYCVLSGQPEKAQEAHHREVAMTSNGELDRFVGKIISIWCGEYTEDSSIITVVHVEEVTDHWLIGAVQSSEHPGKAWFNIRQIVFFYEGDYFSDMKEHIEIKLINRVSKTRTGEL